MKLGWKVVQMERRGEASDRGSQLRQVQDDNLSTPGGVVDIGQLRAQLARRQEEEAARRREAEQKKLLEEVEAAFRGKGPLPSGSHAQTLVVPGHSGRFRMSPTPRALWEQGWEQDQWDPDAKAWRETHKTVEWETGQVARAAAANRGVAPERRLEQTHASSRGTSAGSRSSSAPGRRGGRLTSESSVDEGPRMILNGGFFFT